MRRSSLFRSREILLVLPLALVCVPFFTNADLAPDFCHDYDDGLDTHASQTVYLEGTLVRFCIRSDGELLSIRERHPWRIVDQDGIIVYQPRHIRLELQSGVQVFTDSWDQRGERGENVKSGLYRIIFPDIPGAASIRFTIIPGAKEVSAPVFTEPPETGKPFILLSSYRAVPSATLFVWGYGFDPQDRVFVRLSSTTRETESDANGRWTAVLTAPTKPGTDVVSATSERRRAEKTVTISGKE